MKNCGSLRDGILQHAETPDSSADETDETSDSEHKKNDRNLGMWWKRSPLSYDPVPSQFLYHLEAGYSFYRSEGSITRDNHLVNAKITLRKYRLTDILTYDLDKRNSARADESSISVDDDGNISIGETNLEIRNSKTHELTNHLLFTLTKRFYLGGGLEWTRDDLQEIEDRYLYFIGLGCRVIDKPKYSLRLFGAYGYEELQYTDYYNDLFGGLVIKYKTVDEFDEGVTRSDKYYLSLVARWQATDSLELIHKSDIVGNIEKKDNRYIWRWEVVGGVNYKIRKHLFLNVKFTETYNKEPAIGVRPRDQTAGLGIKLEF